eukprot:scaffold243425_cov41-Tisochrysis_lutea.AAC.1
MHAQALHTLSATSSVEVRRGAGGCTQTMKLPKKEEVQEEKSCFSPPHCARLTYPVWRRRLCEPIYNITSWEALSLSTIMVPNGARERVSDLPQCSKASTGASSSCQQSSLTTGPAVRRPIVLARHSGTSCTYSSIAFALQEGDNSACNPYSCEPWPRGGGGQDHRLLQPQKP